MQTILAEGLGIDAVSPAELLFALEIGFAPGKHSFLRE